MPSALNPWEVAPMSVKILDGMTNAQRYYWRHREAVLAKVKAWADSHPEEMRDKRKQSYQKFKTYYQAKNKAHYATHKQETRARVVKWRQENPDRHRQIQNSGAATYRGRKRAAGTFSVKDVDALKISQRGLCYWCHKPYGRFQVDHVWPLSKGGSNGPENIVLACKPCNHTKNAQTPMEFAGWLL